MEFWFGDVKALFSPFFLFNEYPFMGGIWDSIVEAIYEPFTWLYDPVGKMHESYV